MVRRFISLGVKALFSGTRRGQPLVAAFGTAISIWALFRRLSRKDKPIYSRTLADGEVLRISQTRGALPAVSEEP
jgi:hypothetical protein